MYSSSKEKTLFLKTKTLLKGSELSPEQEINDIKEVINYHEWKYYVNNSPIISDFEYDTLFSRLKVLEEENKGLITEDSPTQRVSKDIAGDAVTVEHYQPMLSLDNSYNKEDLEDFDKRVKKLIEEEAETDIAYCVEPKFDGGTIVLVYENDKLIRAATRGDGKNGEEMTHNARAMRSIPLTAEFSKYGIYRVELRGEALIKKTDFDKINELRAKEGESLFANPRNAATGGLRVKNPQITRDRKLEAFIFQLGFAENEQGDDMLIQFSSHFETINILKELGFKVPNSEMKLCKNIAEVDAFCKMWDAKRDGYDYEIDGLVVKTDSLKRQVQMGNTNHHPRWAIAYKFKAKQATTKLLNVEYQVGKIGSITPVAKLEPVALAGVTVSSVSLHNEDFITSRDLHYGDMVLVERAGDVIPYIVKAFAELRDGTEKKIEFPKECPSCNSELEREESEAAWRCVNTVCSAQNIQRIIYHVSKSGMNIDGFGESYVATFHEHGWLNDIADVYNLPYGKIGELEGFGKRSVEKLEKAINKAKKNPLGKVLGSLSIHHVGRKVSKILAENVSGIYDFQSWNEEQFEAIDEIGPVVAQNVISFFANNENLEMIQRMESYGVNVNQLEEDKPRIIEDTGSDLFGKSILFTGSLQQLKRKEAQQLAIEKGAKVISAVSSKLDILVVGEKAGSKLKKAEAIGSVKIITEQDFVDLIKP